MGLQQKSVKPFRRLMDINKNKTFKLLKGYTFTIFKYSDDQKIME